MTYFCPGSFLAESWVKETDSTEPNEVIWPENAYAFTIRTRIDVIDGEECFQGKSEQIGPMYYHPDSKVETLEEAKINPKSTDILIRNMESNRWAKIVWSRWGNWPQHFDDSKCVVLS